MTVGQFYSVIVLILVALPLGAVGLMTAVYIGFVLRRLPEAAVDMLERHIILPYCWAMTAILLLATVTVGGWTERILLAIVAGIFFAAIHDFLPRFARIKPGEKGSGDGEGNARDSRPRLKLKLSAARQVMTIVSAVQWLLVLIVYVRMMT